MATKKKEVKTAKDLKHLKNLREAKEALENGNAMNMDMEGLIEGYAHGNRAKTIGTDIEKGYKSLIEKRLPKEPAGEQLTLDFEELSISSEVKSDTTYSLDVTLGQMYKISDKLGVTSKYERRTRSKEMFFKAKAAGTLEADLDKHVTVNKQNQFVVNRKKKSGVKVKGDE